DKPVDQRFFRLLLGGMLFFMKDGLFNYILQFVERLVVAEVAGKLIIQRRELFAANDFWRETETHRTAGKAFLSVIGRVRHIHFFRFAWGRTNESFVNRRQGLGRSDLYLDVLLDGPGQTDSDFS